MSTVGVTLKWRQGPKTESRELLQTNLWTEQLRRIGMNGIHTDTCMKSLLNPNKYQYYEAGFKVELLFFTVLFIIICSSSS